MLINIEEFESKIESLTDLVKDEDISDAIQILLRNAVFLGMEMSIDQNEYDTSGLHRVITVKIFDRLKEELIKATS